MLPGGVRDWLNENGFGEIRLSRPVSGGCINNGIRFQVESGEWFFLKSNPQAPVDMFVREAKGLVALEQPGGPRVPKVYCAGSSYLLLEDLAPAAKSRSYWETFGQQMGNLHNHTAPEFGFSHDNYIGSTPQSNTWMADGHNFFATQRLIFQAELANQRGLLGKRDTRLVENLSRRLVDLIPVQPASIIHGDLWSGNIITDGQGNPAIIDPAAHFGWAETDLAMMVLFGSPPERFFKAYQQVRSLPGDYKKRFPIYNLYHLLNHLNLFGMGYYSQVKSILNRYS